MWSGIFGAHLRNLLFVINHQQRHREQDASEALNSFLKAPGRGQLVALLQAGDEVGEAQAHSRQSLFCPTVLKNINTCKFTLTERMVRKQKQNCCEQRVIFFIINNIKGKKAIGQ